MRKVQVMRCRIPLQTSEDEETAADIQNDQTIDTEGIYD